MQELIDWIESTQFPKEGSGNYIYEKAKKLLEKEKEQLLNAFRDNSWNKSFNQYYSETYNQDKELPKDVKDMLNNL